MKSRSEKVRKSREEKAAIEAAAKEKFELMTEDDRKRFMDVVHNDIREAFQILRGNGFLVRESARFIMIVQDAAESIA